MNLNKRTKRIFSFTASLQAQNTLTMWMTGNHDCSKPSVEPLYSGGNREDYNFDVEIDIVNFISGHIKKTKYFILSQHLMQDKYHVIFGIIQQQFGENTLPMMK